MSFNYNYHFLYSLIKEFHTLKANAIGLHILYKILTFAPFLKIFILPNNKKKILGIQKYFRDTLEFLKSKCMIIILVQWHNIKMHLQKIFSASYFG